MPQSSSELLLWQSQALSSPSLPGVYWFLDGDGSVLYVGKAKSLINRLRQYAAYKDPRGHIAVMLKDAKSVRWHICTNELETLLVEAELIRRYHPHFNILLKDDKSSLYIVMTNEKFPRILTARKTDLSLYPKAKIFGPYQSGYRVKQVLKLARTIFRWCDHPLNPDESNKTVTPCFYYHIGMCSGACLGQIRKEDYQTMLRSLQLFLRGKTGSVKKNLKDAIHDAAREEKFEDATKLRDSLDSLERITNPAFRLRPDLTLPTLTNDSTKEMLIALRSILRQHFSLSPDYLPSRIETYDISNISGTTPTSAMVVAVNGQADHKEYRHFSIKTLKTPNDFAMLKETLIRRQKHPEWGMPDLIVIDGGKGQLRSVLEIWEWHCPIISLAKEPDRLFFPHHYSFGKPLPTKSMEYVEFPLTPEFLATPLLTHLRNEAHRFSRRLHHKQRERELFQ